MDHLRFVYPCVVCLVALLSSMGFTSHLAITGTLATISCAYLSNLHFFVNLGVLQRESIPSLDFIFWQTKNSLMRKTLPLFAVLSTILLTTILLPAQNEQPYRSPELMQPQKMVPSYDQVVPVPAEGQAVDTRGTEMDVIIGQTIYDLQTNYAACNRISKDADGNIMAVWTMGFSSGDGYSDRGTGYNRYDAGTGMWMDVPSQRLEAGVRTGWPNHCITDSGTEFIVNHVFTAGEYRLHTLRREAGETAWAESDIPSDTPVGVLWPRASVSGETVHVVAITTPEGLGGEVYEGVSIHPLYYRSSDGGATWEVTDFIIPGLDSSFMTSLVSADSYSLHARGDRVALGVFSQWNDITVFYSDDAGDTWDNIRIFDFPIKKYTINEGYLIDQLPPYDPDQPDSLAIYSSDNSGNILIDKDGKIHAFYGRMYVQDSDTTDAGWTYYPATSGLAYWNEDFGADSTRTIADIQDLNGNDTIDVVGIGNIALYYMSLTSMASAGVDDDNNIFLAYSHLMEGEEYINEDDEQHYRHIYIIKSEDGGETWSEPYDAVNEITLGTPLFVDKVEAVFPHVLKDIGDDLQFWYQQDFRPGLSVQGDEDTPSEYNIVFTQIGGFLTGSEEVMVQNPINLKVFPNPAAEFATIEFELPATGRVYLDLFDASGKLVKQLQQVDAIEGRNQVEISLTGLPAGMYFVRLKTGMLVRMEHLMVK
jgi:hypothetical protein